MKTFTTNSLDGVLRVTSHVALEHVSGHARIQIGLTKYRHRPSESKEEIVFVTLEAAEKFADDIIRAIRIAKGET